MTKLTSPAGARAYIEQVARHRDWVVNPDAPFVVPILEGLATQASRWGRPFCPCRDVDGDNDADIVCPCRYAAADIAEHGQCYCGLFLSREKDPHTVSSIPERRP